MHYYLPWLSTNGQWSIVDGKDGGYLFFSKSFDGCDEVSKGGLRSAPTYRGKIRRNLVHTLIRVVLTRLYRCSVSVEVRLM